MINLKKIKGLGDLKNLSKNLNTFQNSVNQKANRSSLELQKNANSIYTANTTDLVYERYTPINYQRTYHLLGLNGAIDEVLKSKEYTFSIDEESRDPVDGETWKKKANNVESGNMYGVSFPRPFINEIQHKLELENNKIANEYEDYVNNLIKRL